MQLKGEPGVPGSALVETFRQNDLECGSSASALFFGSLAPAVAGAGVARRRTRCRRRRDSTHRPRCPRAIHAASSPPKLRLSCAARCSSCVRRPAEFAASRYPLRSPGMPSTCRNPARRTRSWQRHPCCRSPSSAPPADKHREAAYGGCPLWDQDRPRASQR